MTKKIVPNVEDDFLDMFEILFAVRRGAAPVIDTGKYLAGASLAPGEENARLFLQNAEPGVYHVVVRVEDGFSDALADSAKMRAPALEVSLDVFASRAPNAHNDCVYEDGRLVVEISPGANARTDDAAGSGGKGKKTYLLLGPSNRALGYETVDGAPLPGMALGSAADVYEPAYGNCGKPVSRSRDPARVGSSSPEETAADVSSNETVKTCYLGDAHSSGRVPDLPANAKGHGPVRGFAVLARSVPLRNDQSYRYAFGDVRKRIEGEDSISENENENENENESRTSPTTNEGNVSEDPALFTRGTPYDPSNVDLEACTELLNPDEIRGNVCVAARGSCFFSQKTLACQAAGAVAAIIINTDFSEPAADTWVGSHAPERITIPTLSVSGATGNRLLREMIATDPETNLSSYASNAVRIAAYAYECAGLSFCPACGFGLLSPETECRRSRCPGMNDARTVNCSGHGLGANGGCRLDEKSETAFACACADGYAGEACETREASLDVSGDDSSARAGSSRSRMEETAVVSLAGTDAEPDSDPDADPDDIRRVHTGTRDYMILVGVIILCVATVLVVFAAFATRRRMKNARARREVERHIQNTDL